MNAKKLMLLAALVSAANFASAASADQNWGQWRGPLGNGISPQGNPPTEWSESKNVKWKVPLSGEGHATPIVWDNLVFVQSAVPVKKEAMFNLAPQFAGLQQPPPGGDDGQPPRRRLGGPGGGPGGQGQPGGGGGRRV